MKTLIAKCGAPMAVLLSALSPAQVLAHGGHEHAANFGAGVGGEFINGLMHTLTGWDHFVALAGFGVLIATLKASKRLGAGFMAALALISGLVAGCLASSILGSVSLFEQLVLASVIASPVLILASLRRPHWQSLAMFSVLLFSACHGVVQGVESQLFSGSNEGALLAYNLGLMVSSIALFSSASALFLVLKKFRAKESDVIERGCGGRS